MVIAALFFNAWFLGVINWFYYNSLKIDYILALSRCLSKIEYDMNNKCLKMW